MTTVGIRVLKARVTEYVNRAAAGEPIVISRRGRPVAMLQPLPAGACGMEGMRRSGRVQWAGGKPEGLPAVHRRESRKEDPDVAGAVVEGRQR